MFQARDRTSILVVDDDPLVRDALAGVLVNGGYRVTAIATSFECLNLLSDGHAFDLLILDIAMPPVTPHGFALGRMVRTRNRQQKLLYVSGYGDALPRNELATANAPILRKPMHASELLDAVQQVLAGQDLEAAAANIIRCSSGAETCVADDLPSERPQHNPGATSQ
jgi:CheY-like chemotaxis protein